MGLGSYSAMRQVSIEVQKIRNSLPVKYIHGRQNVNVTGDYIYHSKEVRNSFIVTGGQNCKYTMWVVVKPAKDCWDYTEYGCATEKAYECITTADGASNMKFCNNVQRNTSDAEYCANSYGLKNCFGCVALKSKQYCILNKQYSQEEYEALVIKIRQHMNDMPYVDAKGRTYAYGEFFPIELSQYAYNETSAHEYFPLTKEEAIAHGYRWKDFEEKAHQPTKKWSDLPDKISECDDTMLNDIILCKEWDDDAVKAQQHKCTKAFKLTPYELEFCRRFLIPLPRRCPNSRYYFLTKSRNGLTLYDRSCQQCGVELKSSYSPDKPNIINCDQCYQQSY